MHRINIHDPNLPYAELEQAFKDFIYPEPGSVAGRTVTPLWLNISPNRSKRALAEFPNKTNTKAHLFTENLPATIAVPVWYPKRFGIRGVGYWIGAEFGTNGEFRIVQLTPDFVRVPNGIGNVNAESVNFHNTLKLLYREIFGNLWDVNTFISGADLEIEIKGVLKVYAELCRKVFGEGQSRFRCKEEYWNAPTDTPIEASGLMELYGKAYYVTKFTNRWITLPMDSDSWLSEPNALSFIDLYIDAIRNVEIFALQHEPFRKFEMELSANALKGDALDSKWRLAAVAAVL